MKSIAATLLILMLGVGSVHACGPDALGTSRVITADPVVTPRVGLKHFPVTLPLAPKEVVLTFDDGPWPGTTASVLNSLKAECVRAMFFLLGRNAVANPALAQRTLAEGHTVAHHSYSHPLLDRMPAPKALADVERGMAAVDKILYGAAAAAPRTPFFRFPGFSSSRQLLDEFERRRIMVFGTDVWAGDWIAMAPATQMLVTMHRIEAARGGIVLFHDTKAQTAAMLPPFLRALKAGGYRVVHVAPPGGALAAR